MEIKGFKDLILKVLNNSEAQINILNKSLNVGDLDFTEMFKARIKPFVGYLNNDDKCIICK